MPSKPEQYSYFHRINKSSLRERFTNHSYTFSAYPLHDFMHRKFIFMLENDHASHCRRANTIISLKLTLRSLLHVCRMKCVEQFRFTFGHRVNDIVQFLPRKHIKYVGNSCLVLSHSIRMLNFFGLLEILIRPFSRLSKLFLFILSTHLS